ncbi:4Fe-4S dicluster protein [Lachnotalea glycerini]|jgi:NAD-dependent dihydropyrimidine dehydrogenase PreA subunit|uniref:4Fe-4S dicluster domain-containing protein n=1 Tax=Lachnotalea glycerini TaxID=1763509 RepID=A0A255I1Q6_9FIRM|nr:4Fe-4S dicluster domain-containing protein [Lachnotalea glycerini]OYP36522.1 4Fe-4S ferredoxin [Lachnotalea glycerini]PXV93831.1 4Fe-4S dicluster protein [Lachnotalea glycerini]RDY30929.1 4Fe-4S dicluster domain-containing protein [Lachnotalea glycerini]
MTGRRIKKYAVVTKRYCVGCGSCIKECPKEAISVPNGVFAIVDLEKCVGCGLCVKICPASVIHIKTDSKEAL